MDNGKTTDGSLSNGKKHKGSFLTATTVLAPALTVVLLIALTLSGKLLSSQLSMSSSSDDLFLMVSVAQIIIFIFPCIIYYFIRGRKLNTPFMLSALMPSKLVLTLASLFLLISGNILIKSFYYIGFGSIPSGISYLSTEITVLEDAPAFAVILAFAMIPAICEEFFFRGILLAEYRAYGGFNGVVFSAICFAMIHFSLKSFPLYLYSGLVLGVAALATRSVFASVIVHFFSNVINLYVSDAFLRVTIQKSGPVFTAFISGALFLLSLVFLLSQAETLLWKRSEAETGTELPPKSIHNFAKVFITPGFFVLILVFLLITLIR